MQSSRYAFCELGIFGLLFIAYFQKQLSILFFYHTCVLSIHIHVNACSVFDCKRAIGHQAFACNGVMQV